ARQEPLCFVSCFTIAEKERPCNVVAAQHVAHSRISFEALSASELTGSQAESPEFEHLFCALGPTGRVQFITDRGRQQLRSEAVARGRGERLAQEFLSIACKPKAVDAHLEHAPFAGSATRA